MRVPERIGVDETSFQKRHEYVTVINDLDEHVLHVADGRGKDSVEEYYKQFDREQLAEVRTVAMDMWGALHPRDYPSTWRTRRRKIAFGKLHGAGHRETPLTGCGEPSTAGRSAQTHPAQRVFGTTSMRGRRCSATLNSENVWLT